MIAGHLVDVRNDLAQRERALVRRAPCDRLLERLKLLRVAANALQRLIELVRDSRRELAQGGHFARLNESFLHGLKLGVFPFELKIGVAELGVLGDELALHALFLGHVPKQRHGEQDSRRS